jgi:hypothetical protein
MHSADIVTRSMNLLIGIAWSHAWHSTGSSSFDTVLISNLVNSRQPLSICDLGLCIVSRMRRLIAAY